MKLASRIQRSNLLLMPIYFILAVIVIYFVVRLYMHENIEERLLFQKDVIIQQMNDGLRPHFKGYLEISPSESKNTHGNQFSTVSIYDPHEDEMVPYKKLTFSTTIDTILYNVIITQPLGETEQIITDLTKGLLLIFSVFIGISYFVIFRINKKVLQPFYRNLTNIKEFDIAAIDNIQLEHSNIDEFEDLNNAVARMTQKIQADYQNLKSFTENASHEIQTPLAVIKSNVDILVQSGDLNESQMRHIVNIEEYATKLQKLNKSLLLLAKIENNQFLAQEDVCINTLITNQTDLLEDLFDLRNIRIEKEILEPVKITISPVMAEVLFQNLIKNAMYYCNENGIIRIELTQCKFSISNTGKPLSINPDLLFERFKKNNQSSSSLGLGLAIVKKICDQNNIDIKYSYKVDYHKFELFF